MVGPKGPHQTIRFPVDGLRLPFYRTVSGEYAAERFAPWQPWEMVFGTIGDIGCSDDRMRAMERAAATADIAINRVMTLGERA